MSDIPGRSCPLHYRYRPEDLAAPPTGALAGLQTLYVAGGLYGNEFALDALERLLEAHAARDGRRAVVFNGDFHWFDAEPDWFARVQRRVLAHTALRGNVETELAVGEADAGCGCAYPDWVDDGVVERSNRIHAQLQAATTAAQRAELAALPMHATASVGGRALALVHGDATSLAGWGFAVEHLREAAHRATVAGWFERAGVDAFVATHTCLPVFRRVRSARGDGWVLNNGAAGMPNFSGDTAGLVIRLGVTPFTAAAPRLRAVLAAAPAGRGEALHAEALALEFDTAAWQARFAARWPPGSDAHHSYARRIAEGPAHHVGDALHP